MSGATLAIAWHRQMEAGSQYQVQEVGGLEIVAEARMNKPPVCKQGE